MEEVGVLESGPSVGPNHDYEQKNEYGKLNLSLTRSDSGNQSSTSTDLCDEDTLQNGHAPGAYMPDSPSCVNTNQSQTLLRARSESTSLCTGFGCSVPAPENFISDKDSLLTESMSSTCLQHSPRKIERQNSFDTPHPQDTNQLSCSPHPQDPSHLFLHSPHPQDPNHLSHSPHSQYPSHLSHSPHPQNLSHFSHSPHAQDPNHLSNFPHSQNPSHLISHSQYLQDPNHLSHSPHAQDSSHLLSQTPHSQDPSHLLSQTPHPQDPNQRSHSPHPQDPSYLSQTLYPQDPSHLLSQTPPLNPSSIDNDRLMTQDGHSAGLNDTGILGSPAVSVQSGANSCGNNLEVNSDHTPFTVLANSSENSSQVLTNGSQSSVQNLLLENHHTSSVATANLQHNNSKRCLSEPASSVKMPAHVSEFVSLHVAPLGVVPKHIMDSLAKELDREKLKVHALKHENSQLLMTIAELETWYQTKLQHSEENIFILHDQAAAWKKKLQRSEENIFILHDQAAAWKKKLDNKEKELDTKVQELKASHDECSKLKLENKNVNQMLQLKQSEKQRFCDKLESVETILQDERFRFNRDEISLKEKIEHLKQENQWLKEGLEAAQGFSPSTVIREDSRSGNVHTRPCEDVPCSEQSMDRSGVTELKGVYPEYTNNHDIHQEQGARPKQASQKSSSDEVHEMQGARPKQGYRKSSNTKNNVPLSEEKCGFCYKESSTFDSYEKFIEHKKRCGP